MAYIPDEAVDESSALSPTAFKLYALVCRRRDHKRQSASLSTKSAATLLRVNLGTARRAFAELVHEAWIARNGNLVIPIKGSFSPVSRYPSQRAQESAPSAQNSAPSAQESAQSAQNCAPTLYDYPASLSSSDHPASSSNGSQALHELDRWTSEAKRANNEMPSHLVELGVLATLLARKPDADPIRSVNYFRPMITQYAELPLFQSEDFGRELIQTYTARLIKWTSQP